jgi:hypothetical protein
MNNCISSPYGEVVTLIIALMLLFAGTLANLIKRVDDYFKWDIKLVNLEKARMICGIIEVSVLAICIGTLLGWL